MLFHLLPGSSHVCAFCSRGVSSKIEVKLVSAEVVGGKGELLVKNSVA